MNSEISEIIKDLSEAALAIVTDSQDVQEQIQKV